MAKEIEAVEAVVLQTFMVFELKVKEWAISAVASEVPAESPCNLCLKLIATFCRVNANNPTE